MRPSKDQPNDQPAGPHAPLPCNPTDPIREPGRLQALERPQGLVVLGHLPGQLGEPAFGLLAGIAGDGAPALEYTLDRCGQEGPRQR